MPRKWPSNHSLKHERSKEWKEYELGKMHFK
jgi:hypothetical protein